MRKEERKTCLDLVDAGMDIGAHDTNRLIIYCDALEAAAVKMYRSVTGFRALTEEDFTEIKECMKVALPPGEL